jgi:Domain of unknown function (DUF4129)
MEKYSKTASPMKYKYCIYFGWLLLLFAVNNGYAQTQSKAGHSNSILKANKKQKSVRADTINSRIINVVTDSIDEWKAIRSFSYMSYLDSLLRQRSSERIAVKRMAPDNVRVEHKADYSRFNHFFNQTPVKIFLWLLAAAFIGMAVYKIFYRQPWSLRSGKPDALFTDENKILTIGNFSEYDSLIAAAETKKDFRLAVRNLYLQSLALLNQKHYIRFSPEKTNHQYRDEMNAHEMGLQFNELTNHFEYVWYGAFRISESRYQEMKLSFNSFNKEIE